jgi:hypothetical protein
VLPHFWRAVDQHRTALHILESRGRVTDGGEGTGKVNQTPAHRLYFLAETSEAVCDRDHTLPTSLASNYLYICVYLGQVDGNNQINGAPLGICTKRVGTSTLRRALLRLGGPNSSEPPFAHLRYRLDSDKAAKLRSPSWQAA